MSGNEALDWLGTLFGALRETRQNWVLEEFTARVEETEVAGRNYEPHRQLEILLDTITECLIHPVEFASKAEENLRTVTPEMRSMLQRNESGVPIETVWNTPEARALAVKLRRLINTLRKELTRSRE